MPLTEFFNVEGVTYVNFVVEDEPAYSLDEAEEWCYSVIQEIKARRMRQ